MRLTPEIMARYPQYTERELRVHNVLCVAQPKRPPKSSQRDMARDPVFMRLYEQCKPYTMTSMERLYAVYEAVAYLARNRIPGDIVECGVWKGGSSMMAALALAHHGDDGSRRLWLYDTFTGMPEPGPQDVKLDGGDSAEKWREHKALEHNGWNYGPLDDVRANMARTGFPAERMVLVPGKVEETLAVQRPQRIALLRLDTDFYELDQGGAGGACTAAEPWCHAHRRRLRLMGWGTAGRRRMACCHRHAIVPGPQRCRRPHRGHAWVAADGMSQSADWLVEWAERPQRYDLLVLLPNLGRGGAQRVASLLIDAWAAQGYRICVATFSDKTEDAHRLDPRVTRLRIREFMRIRTGKAKKVEKPKARERLATPALAAVTAPGEASPVREPPTAEPRLATPSAGIEVTAVPRKAEAAARRYCAGRTFARHRDGIAGVERSHADGRRTAGPSGAGAGGRAYDCRRGGGRRRPGRARDADGRWCAASG